MAKKVLLTLCVFFFYTNSQAQTTQDTIDNPYWIEMMSNNSNNFYNVKRAYTLYYSNKPLDKSSKKFHRWASYWKQYINADGSFPAPDKVLKEYRKFKSTNLQPRSTIGDWNSYGPKVNPTAPSSEIGIGRINAIGFHPTDPNTIYAGAPQGGFWVSTNKGISWSSSTDDMPTLGVSAIVALPSTGTFPKIIIGTGDRDGSSSAGMGVFISNDGGVTFSPSNTGLGNFTVGMFAVNAVNNNTIFAATSNGIYVTYNQGANWVKKSSNSVNYKDIKYCPTDTNIIYATAAGTFYRSTNAGNTWTTVSTGMNSITRNRLAIGVTPHNGDIVYLVASKTTDNTLEAFYKSSNKGVNFTPMITNTPNILGGKVSGNDTRGQGWYDLAIKVSPTDSNRIIVGGINTFRSINGGATWTCTSSWYGESGKPYVHADIHYLEINPLNSELYIGSDGGVDKTINFGNSFTNLNDSLVITQFYNLGVSQLSNTTVIGGAQDNGSMKGNAPLTWNYLTGGDGMYCDISNQNLNKIVTTVQHGKLYYSTDNGVNFNAEVFDTSDWITPLQIHPKYDNIFVIVFPNVWYSKNFFGGNTFTKLTTGNTTQQGSAIRFSNINENLVFMGWDNGSIKYIDNLLAASPSITNATNPPGGGSGSSDINDIETSFIDENTIYVCQGNRVYKSSNKGTTYVNITGNLPDITKKCIVLDKNSNEGLYVGTTAGVYYKNASMPQWVLFNNGLPTNSSVTDLEIVYDSLCSSNSVLFASTYGRGMWRGDLFTDVNNPLASFDIPSSKCVGTAVNITNTSTNTVASSVYKWTITPNTGVTYLGGTDSTSLNPIVQFNTQGNYSVSLKVTNPSGAYCTVNKPNVISVGNVGNISFLTGSSASLCLGDTAVIKLTGMDTFIWPSSIPKVDIINDSTAIIRPTTTTTYSISGTINGACPDTVEYVASINPVIPYTINGLKKTCNGDSAIITITGPDSITWAPNPFSLSNKGKNAVIKSSSTVVYSLIMTRTNWCTIKKNIILNVVPIPNYVLNVPKINTICLGDSLLVTESNVPNNVWSPATGLNTTTGDNVVVKPIVNTKYYVGTTDTNYCNKTDTILFNVIPKPTVTIIGKKELCFNETMLLVANGASSYVWSPMTDLTVLSDDSVICSANSNIKYTVIGTTATCNGQDTLSISVGQSMPSLKLTGDSIMCKNSFTDLTISGANQYLWSPDSIVSNPYGIKVRVRPSKSTIIKVIGNNSGCRDSLSYPITVMPTPNIKFASLSKTSICEGESITFNGSGGVFYMVNPNYNVTKLTNESFKAYPFQNTTYFLVGFDSKGCSALDSTIIKVNPKPVVSITPNISTIYQRDSLILTATGASTYVWKPDSVISGSSTSSSVKIKPMSYVLMSVVGTTAEQCSSESLAQVYVLYKAPDTTRPSGINLIQDRVLLVYPIPANNQLIIDGKEKTNYSLIDISGRVLMDSRKLSFKHELDVEHLSNGNYMLQIETEDQVKNSIKIEIKH